LSIESVKKDLGADAELFDYEEKDGVVAGKLKKFYRDRNEFAKIAQRVKVNANGVYVPKDKGGPYFVFKGEVAEPKEPTAPGQLDIGKQRKLTLNETMFQVRAHLKDVDKLLKEAGY